ncbi:hypothetical protein EI71_01123 [Anaeroplasma bactoclasticum]|jgi:hypothetical protein|uniref:Uncharacterized protein n=1 Tax=Anaeroplasma bactoclasticum TaxID=2088 RepID=A0A397RSW2_9MOLU|nr:DUF308 domain-containing protein [Anaeroplasma bactoclasticum]RIA75826.1 hypothetical protein EI71_01123 [Anaeroplasma bactoclasticum]
MTREERKALDYLRVMEMPIDHEITRLELKNQFLMLEEKYNPNNIENGIQYFDIKNAYDYLYDHMELLNEAIHNALNPYNETHEYSYSYCYTEDEVNNIKEEKEKKDEYFNPGNINTMPEIKDRPTVFGAVLSLLSPVLGFLMFALTRKVTPKSSWLYLILAILSIAVSFVALFFLV